MLIKAAILATRPRHGTARVLASGRAAVHLLGVDVPFDDPIHVATIGRPRPTPIDGVMIHRPTHLLDLTPHDFNDPVPHARVVRALLDVAAWDPALTSSVLEQLIVKRLLTLSDAQAALRRHSKQGRPGLKVLREAVDAWGLRQRPPDSVLEERFAKLRAEYGLPEFEFQRPVGRFRPDFCRPLEMVIIECDGFKNHGQRQAQVEADNARDAELTADGWLVMRFTWHQINKRSAWVASRILSTLRRRAAQLGLSA